MGNANIFFEQVTIIGVGLMGGSLALAGKDAGVFGEIVGCGRKKENLIRAIELSVIDEYCIEMSEAVKNADLVIVATPVMAIKKIFCSISKHLKKDCVVIDLGSIKEKIVHWADEESITSFVGVHPIAGTELSGVEASSRTLYKGAWCILTPDEKTNPKALALVKKLWEAIGSKVSTMSVKKHDNVLAAISHLPHVVAYALVNTVNKLDKENNGEVLSFSAGGFKDFTRIASSHPEMWSDICLGNREFILNMIERFGDELTRIKESISSFNKEDLERTFQEARDARNSLLNDV